MTTLPRSGGLLSSAATVAEAAAAPVEVFRADYEPPPYAVANVRMNFIIRDGETTVHAEMKIVPNDAAAESTARGDMTLNGDASAITLRSIRLDGVDLVCGTDYRMVGDALLVPSSTLNDGGVLSTIVDIVPETNTQLSGLYKSGGKMYCTQCEAMG